MDLQSVATGLIVGVVVAIVTFRLSVSLERERWQREDRIRVEDLERQAIERWSNERRELFGRMLRLADDLRRGARDAYGREDIDKGWDDAWDNSYQVAMEIMLIDPPLGALAEALSTTATNHLVEAAKWSQGAAADAEPPDLHEREAELEHGYETFLAAAQANLRGPRDDVRPTS
jgi:hypothetical protein